MTSKTEVDEVAAAASQLTDAIRPMFADASPDAVGAALAELTAIYMIAHNPEIRTDILEHWIELVRGLMVAAEKEFFPHGWGQGSSLQ